MLYNPHYNSEVKAFDEACIHSIHTFHDYTKTKDKQKEKFSIMA